MGNKLKQYRELAGLTQQELANRAKVSQEMISRMEQPEHSKTYRGMSGEFARRLAAVLRVGVFELSGSLDAAADGLPAREIQRLGRWIEDLKAGR
jgi:transcriptional regulator with XRE-family HTH domain